MTASPFVHVLIISALFALTSIHWLPFIEMHLGPRTILTGVAVMKKTAALYVDRTLDLGRRVE